MSFFLKTALTLSLAFALISPSAWTVDRAVIGVEEATQTQAPVGIFSGSFDPVTLSHLEIIRDSFKKYNWKKFYIFINIDGPKTFKSSSEQRIALLKAALPDLVERIEFLAVNEEERHKTVAAIGKAHPLHYRLFGEDTAQRIYANALFDPTSHWIVYLRPGEPSPAKDLKIPRLSYQSISLEGISSTRTRELLAKEGDTGAVLDPRVADYIHRHGLYFTPPPKLNHAHEVAHRQSFSRFLSDLKTVLPEIDTTNMPTPPYDPMQTPEAREEQFMNWVASKNGLKGDLLKRYLSISKKLLSMSPDAELANCLAQELSSTAL